MAESNTEKKEQAEKPATEAQVRLIKNLYEETQFPKPHTDAFLLKMTREEASRQVHLLKEYKVRDTALRSANQPVPQFDKIGFGMVYKLVWKAASETPLAMKLSRQDFIDRAIGEYKVFKDAQKACKEHVKESGRQ